MISRQLLQLSLLCLGRLPSTIATPINVTISHLSPTINYSPSRSGESGNTWNVTYTQPQPAPNNGSIGDGPSSHFTTFNGASASLGFVGTSVYVYGYVNGSTDDVSLSVGGQKLNEGGQDGLLGWKEGLEDRWWDLAVNVTGSGGVGIRGITFTVDFGNKGASLANTTLYALDESNNPNSQVSFTGSWTTGTEAGLDRRPYDRVDTYGQDARAILPSIGSPAFILIYGSVNYDHSDYFVSTSSDNAWPSTTTMNGESPWISINEVIYFGEVDEGDIVLQNMNGGNWLDFSKIIYTTASGGEVRHRSKTGAIVGGVLGGLIGLGLLVAGVWWFWRKRKSDTGHYSSAHADTGAFEIDPYKETTRERQTSQNSYFDDPEFAYASAASGSIGSAWADRPQANPYESPAPYRSPSPTLVTPEPRYINPYPPTTTQESRSSSDQTPSRRLALVTPQTNMETDAGTFPEGVHIPEERKERRRQRPAPRSGVLQETDAGRVALVPPSYDPAWARDGFTNESPPPTSSRDGSQTDMEGRSELDLLVRGRSPRTFGESQTSGSDR